ncbi:MAG: ATP-binding protein [Chthoniobacter sp.]
MRGSNVQCEFDLEPDVWELNADPNQLAQVISNVVLNAMEATPGGGGIQVSAENTTSAPHLPDGDYVAIRVRDFGVGIATDRLPRIFDPFFTTKNQRADWGSPAAYSIMQRHGGYIGVQSTPRRRHYRRHLFPGFAFRGSCRTGRRDAQIARRRKMRPANCACWSWTMRSRSGSSSR